MKKRFLLLKFFVPAVMLAMVSCDKEELPDLTKKELAFTGPDAVLKKMQVSQINANGHVFDFTYGSNGKPEKVTAKYQSKENEDGTSHKAEEEYTLVYEGDRLKEVNKEVTYTRNLADGTQEMENVSTKVAYIYNENGLVGEVQKTFFTKLPDNTSREITFSNQYLYNNENRVVKITNFAQGQKSGNYTTLEWNGGNLTKQTIFNEDGSTGEEVVFSNYDDRINPMMLLGILNGNSSGPTLNENNVGKIVNYMHDKNGNLKERQAYTKDITYDSKGRPVHYKETLTVHELDETYVHEYTITYRD